MILLFCIGNLGDDAVMNKTESGRSVINFNVARTKTWKNSKGEKQTETEWVDCAYFTDNEPLFKLLKKGKQVHVEGEPKPGVHIRKDGVPTAVMYLKVAKIQLL